MKKNLLTGLLLFLTMLSVYAQPSSANQAAETVVVFKFLPQDDGFYERGNQIELNKLYLFVEQYKTEITSGQLPIFVTGYCASFDNRAENLKTAAVRSNRVKSELIIKKGLKEENFKTANHATDFEGGKDVVTVSFVFEEIKVVEDFKEIKEEPTPVVEQVETGRAPSLQPAKAETIAEPETTPVIGSVSEAIRKEGNFSIRTNLLYWAVATPNLGIEYRPSANFGILVNGAYSHWIWKGEDNHHRTWMVQPEVRYYLGENKNWFLGLEGHAGEFNFKFKDTGYQGDAVGGGITGGYRLRLSRVFDLDFSLGLGYTQLKYETYYRSNGYMVKKETGLKKNFFGPTQAGVSICLNLDL